MFNAFFIDDKTNRVETNASYELFRRRPDLQFWYPPYANPQPMFDADGNNTVNLCECNGKTLAVSKMKLASSKLIAERDFTSLRYTFQFGPSSNDGGVTIVFPEDAIAKSSIIRFRNFSIVATP